MTPRAWLAVGIVVVLCAALVWAYRFGVKNDHNANEAAKVAVVAKGIEKHNAAAVAGHAVEVQTIAREQRVDAYFRGLRTEAPNATPLAPFPGDCVLDPVRLRRWTAANAGPEGDTARGSDDAGRSAAAAEERSDGGPLRQPPGGDAPVLAPARALDGAGQVAGKD